MTFLRLGIRDLLATKRQSGGKKTTVHFEKMHGLGNDFVMLSDTELCKVAVAALSAQCTGEEADSDSVTPDAAAAWARDFCSRLAGLVCDRHFSVGADGLIVAIDLARLNKTISESAQAEPSAEVGFWHALHQYLSSYPGLDKCELAWMYINSDGSYSEMCGNGLRCFSLFVHNLGWIKNNTFTLATLPYPVTATITKDCVEATGTACGGEKAVSENQTIEVVTRLGGPKFFPAEVPLDMGQIDANLPHFVDQTIEVNGKKLAVTCVSMGNPHCVIFEQPGLDLGRYAVDIKTAHDAGRALEKFPDDLVRLGLDIQRLSLFPAGANIEFVKVAAPDTAVTFVVERGCGATLACASGAAAVLAAGVKSGRLNKKSYVILPGGKLEAKLSTETKEERVQEYIELTGPAAKVFSGELTLDLALLAADTTAPASKSGASREGLCV